MNTHAHVPGGRLFPFPALWSSVIGVIAAVVAAAPASAATTWTVCASGCAYTTIEAAVNSVNTLDGDTISVAAGNYAVANANINKSLTLLGAKAGVDARLPSRGTGESVITTGNLGVFSLNAANITFDGFQFTNLVNRTIDTTTNADNFTMRNCMLSGNVGSYSGGGIQFGGPPSLHANGLLFEQNLVTADNGYLLYMGHAMDNGTIRNNAFHGDSVSFGPFGDRTGWLIEGNDFNGDVPGHGPYWGFGFNANLGDVIIRNNTVTKMGIGLGQISVVGGSITGNTFDDNQSGAFQLWGGEFNTVVSKNVTIQNNLIKYNGSDAASDSAGLLSHGFRLRPDCTSPGGGGGPCLTPAIVPDAATIHVHVNRFIDLNLSGGKTQVWAIRQNMPNSVDATLNYWGTTVAAEVAAKIGKSAADGGSGLGDTVPFITSYTDDPAKAGQPGFWPLAYQDPGLALDPLSGITYGSPQANAHAFSSSAGLITYGTTTPGVCTVNPSSGAFTINSAGNCGVTAHQAADGAYAADDASTSFTISQANQAPLTLITTTPLIYNASETLSVTGGTTGGTVTYNLLTGPCAILGNQLTANSGSGSCTLTATMAGDTNYNPVTSTPPNTVNLAPGPVSAATSTVVAVPTSVPPDGSTTSTITVTLKDAGSNTVAGKTVTLTAGSGSSVIATVNGMTNAGGQASFTVKDAVPQSVTYTAKDTTDNVTPTQTATVTFTTGCTTDCYVNGTTGNDAFGGDSPATAKKTIQAAVTQVSSGGTVHVAAGLYTETVVIAKALTLSGAQAGVAAPGTRTFGGPAESRVEGAAQNGNAGAITISAANVVVDGFSLSHTVMAGSANAVVINNPGNGTIIRNNLFDSINTPDPGGNGTAQAIYLQSGPDNVQILNNGAAHIQSARSAKFVLIGDNGGTDPSVNVLIQGNTIGTITSTARGAYAVGVGSVTPGASGLQIRNNTIDSLTGTWVHAIGLEGDTPSVVVSGNTITNIVTSPASPDRIGVWFENNPSFAGATVTTNNLDVSSAATGIGVSDTLTMGNTAGRVTGTCNWWGAASGPSGFGQGAGSQASGGVTFSPWWVAANGPCTGNVVSSGASTVVAAPTSVPADGSSTSTITVTLKDGGNNLLSGKTVTLAASGGSSTITTLNGTTDVNGQAKFTVKDAVVQSVTYTATDATDGVTVTQTAAVSFTSLGPAAVFVKSDTSTQGNWKGVYGSQGQAIANDSTNYPSFAQVGVSTSATWTWASSTTDGRALQRAATGRIASCWCANTFDFDVNLTDGASHQVALYAIDWDNIGRAERVDVLAFGTTTVLDTRTLTGFSGGRYLVWTLSGHVTIRVTLTGGANAVVSGLFFDVGSAGGPIGPTVATGSATGVTTNSATLAGTVNPNGVATMAYFQYGTTTSYTTTTSPVSVGTGMSAVPVTTSVNVLACGTPYHFRIVGQSSAGTSFGLDGQFTTTACPGGPSASFVGTDSSTQGNWKGVYGSQGAAIVNDSTNYPSFAPVTVSTNSTWTWASSTTDGRALQRAATGRIAACWCASTFDFDVNITDGQPHQVALYALDWDNLGRAERVDILAFGTTNVLDTRTLTGFSGGKYLQWTLGGHVTIRITLTAGANAVVSGLFFDGGGAAGGPTVTTGTATGVTMTNATLNGTVNPNGLATSAFFQYGTTTSYTDSTSPVTLGSGTSALPVSTAIGGLTCGAQYHFRAVGQSSGGTSFGLDGQFNTPACPGGPSAVFVSNDTSTRGNWKGVYGSQAAAIVNDVLTYPSYAQVTPSTNVTWTWASSTTDTRALQRTATGRIAACWCASTFTFDINITDGQTHQIALYALDWDNIGRAERVDVKAFGTNTLLDTRTLTSFSGGQYLSWNVSGHVTITITLTAGANAVVSGLFFDPVGGGATSVSDVVGGE